MQQTVWCHDALQVQARPGWALLNWHSLSKSFDALPICAWTCCITFSPKCVSFANTKVRSWSGMELSQHSWSAWFMAIARILPITIFCDSCTYKFYARGLLTKINHVVLSTATSKLCWHVWLKCTNACDEYKALDLYNTAIWEQLTIGWSRIQLPTHTKSQCQQTQRHLHEAPNAI